MNKEIERKFLVKNDNFKEESILYSKITQGYISSLPERVVRVRLEDFNNRSLNLGYLTIKGASSETGVSRYEWETEIEFGDAKDLIKLCEPGIIEKIRYRVYVGDHKFEVDEFLGKNKGLVIAEIELNSEDEEFKKPEWLGKEVTGNPKYFNSNLK